MISTKIEHAQTNGCTEAEAQQEFGVCDVEALKPRSYPDQEYSRDHEETGDENVEEYVAKCPHTTRCLSGIFEFLQVPAEEQSRRERRNRGIPQGNQPQLQSR